LPFLSRQHVVDGNEVAMAGFQKSHLLLRLCGQPDIVAVQKGDELRLTASTPLLHAARGQPGGRRTTRSPGNASDTSSIQAFDSKTTTMVSHSTV
jgi:hypothetical protein